MQHNRGTGAARTRKHGRVWRALLHVRGFSTYTAAQRFEWRWQHPQRLGVAIAGRAWGSTSINSRVQWRLVVLWWLLRQHHAHARLVPRAEGAPLVVHVDASWPADVQAAVLTAVGVERCT